MSQALAILLSQILTADHLARNKSLAQLIALVNLPMPLTAFQAVLWLGATRSAAVRYASLGFRVALNVVSLAVTLAVNLNRARLDSTLIESALDVGSLFNLIVTATQPLEAHYRGATGHLAGWAVWGIESASALFGFVVSSTQASGARG